MRKHKKKQSINFTTDTSTKSVFRWTIRKHLKNQNTKRATCLGHFRIRRYRFELFKRTPPNAYKYNNTQYFRLASEIRLWTVHVAHDTTNTFPEQVWCAHIDFVVLLLRVWSRTSRRYIRSRIFIDALTRGEYTYVLVYNAFGGNFGSVSGT